MSQEKIGDLERFEELLSRGLFSDVDSALDQLDPTHMEPAEILVVLSITWHGRGQLTRRTAFLERSEGILCSKLGTERAQKLLEYRR